MTGDDRIARSEDVTLPVHVGIIMDGNGRWAVRRGLARSRGHKEGLNAAKAVVKAASDIGIKYVTLYTFSTENWKRTQEEVSFLMTLICQNLKREYDFYRENRIRVIHSGSLAVLPPAVQAAISQASRDTEHHPGLVVNLAINYGGRDEIVRAVNRWLENASPGADRITEGAVESFLDHPEIPAPDLIIRTAGEKRISNFLLWQSAYSELCFSDKLWPDFSPEDLRSSLLDYSLRRRRFGGTD